MDRCLKTIFLLFIQLRFVVMDFSLVQEAAQLDSVNEKYLRDVTVLTRRGGRGARYLTNVNGTILHEWNNNVTFLVEIHELGRVASKLFEISYKLCDAFNAEWISSMVYMHSEIASCPIHPGTYHFVNVDGTVRQLTFLRGLTNVKLVGKWLITATREHMATGSIRLRVVNTPKTAKKDNTPKSRG